MENSEYYAKLFAKISCMKEHRFVYNSMFPNTLVNRFFVHKQEYVIHTNCHTTGTHNRFLLTGRFANGFSTVQFGGDLLEKILTISTPPIFKKIL